MATKRLRPGEGLPMMNFENSQSFEGKRIPHKVQEVGFENHCL